MYTTSTTVTNWSKPDHVTLGAGKIRPLLTVCLTKVDMIGWNPNRVPTRFMTFVRWHSPSQALIANPVLYPQLTATVSNNAWQKAVILFTGDEPTSKGASNLWGLISVSSWWFCWRPYTLLARDNIYTVFNALLDDLSLKKIYLPKDGFKKYKKRWKTS